MAEYQRRRVYGSTDNPLKQKADGTLDIAVTMGAGDPILKIGAYAGAAITYQELAIWTVNTGKTGILKEIAFTRDAGGKALFKITVNDTEIITDFNPVTNFDAVFSPNEMDAGSVTKIEVKSSDGTAINVNGIITGDEE